MNFLLTNDDGWGAPGLRLLEKVARQMGNVWTVAPAAPMSGISHQLTFEDPMTMVAHGDQSYSLTGTPADCTRIGLTQLNVEFDAVISGINNGANLGADIYVSGTVAAAREAWLMGVNGWAISQHRLNMAGDFDWDSSAKLSVRVLERLLKNHTQTTRSSSGESDGSSDSRPELININLPDHSNTIEKDQSVSIVECKMDPNGLPVGYIKDDQGRFIYTAVYNDRKRVAGHDIETCFGGNVAMCKIG